MASYNKKLAGVIFVLAAAACQPIPPAVTPPPPIVVAPPAPPPMPLPPGGAAASTVVPPLGLDGVRMTPNRGLTRDEHLWNFRIALNVAALNCWGPVWGEIAQNYNQILPRYKNTLARINRAVDSEYISKHGARRTGQRARDEASTALYNYFALPPVKSAFCNKALEKSRGVLALDPVTRAGFEEYAFTGLNDIDRIFVDFYDAYAQYEIDLANWHARYGTPQPASSFTAAPPASSPDVTFTEPPITTEPEPEPQSNEVIFAPGTGETEPRPPTGKTPG